MGRRDAKDISLKTVNLVLWGSTMVDAFLDKHDRIISVSSGAYERYYSWCKGKELMKHQYTKCLHIIIYLQKKSDIDIKRVIVYDAVSDKSVILNISYN